MEICIEGKQTLVYKKSRDETYMHAACKPQSSMVQYSYIEAILQSRSCKKKPGAMESKEEAYLSGVH